jgi:hypothetical protein
LLVEEGQQLRSFSFTLSLPWAFVTAPRLISSTITRHSRSRYNSPLPLCQLLPFSSLLGTCVCGTAVHNITVGPLLHLVLAFSELPSAVNNARLFIPVLLFSRPLYIKQLFTFAAANKLPCLDATLRDHLCPLLVIPLVPCKLLFGSMVRAILLSSQTTYIELTWIFRPWSTEAAPPTESTCNTQGH